MLLTFDGQKNVRETTPCVENYKRGNNNSEGKLQLDISRLPSHTMTFSGRNRYYRDYLYNCGSCEGAGATANQEKQVIGNWIKVVIWYAHTKNECELIRI